MYQTSKGVIEILIKLAEINSKQKFQNSIWEIVSTRKNKIVISEMYSYDREFYS